MHFLFGSGNKGDELFYTASGHQPYPGMPYDVSGNVYATPEKWTNRNSGFDGGSSTQRKSGGSQQNIFSPLKMPLVPGELSADCKYKDANQSIEKQVLKTYSYCIPDFGCLNLNQM
jgi:hypothetical protein